MEEDFGEIIQGFSKTPQQPDEFGEVLSPTFEQPKSQIPRHLARSASRAGEAVIGLPGDIMRSAGAGAALLEKGAGKIREKIGLSPLKSGIKEGLVPGSAQLKKYSRQLFGDIVEPETETEAFFDDIIGDAAVLAIPLKAKIPLKSFIRPIGTAIAGNLASKGAEKLGIGETGQNIAKLGTFFVSGLVGKGGLKKFWNEKYSEAEKAIPEGAELDAFNLDRQLDQLDSVLRKGGIETPSQIFVQKPLKELKNTILDGRMKVEDAVAAKKKINELRGHLFEDVKSKEGRKYARTKINDIAKFLDESLETYGKENPSFYKPYKEANEAFAGYQQSRKAGRWVNEMIEDKVGKGGKFILKHLFAPASYSGMAGLKAGELATRVLKNATTRKYYTNLMKDAVKENQKGFLKNLGNLEKALREEEEFGELLD